MIEQDTDKKSEGIVSRAPVYLVFEGVDGSGKSTLAKAVCEQIAFQKKPAFFAFPSSSGEVGKLIRRAFSGDVVLGDGQPGGAPNTRDRVLGYLMVADGLEREHEIRRCIARRTSVVCDRHPIVSGWVYQRSCWPVDTILAIQQRWQFHPPHATFVLDLPAEVAIERMKKRGPLNPIYERDGVDHVNTMRERYVAYTAMHDNTRILDGTKTTDQLVDHVREQLRRWEVVP